MNIYIVGKAENKLNAVWRIHGVYGFKKDATKARDKLKKDGGVAWIETRKLRVGF